MTQSTCIKGHCNSISKGVQDVLLKTHKKFLTKVFSVISSQLYLELEQKESTDSVRGKTKYDQFWSFLDTWPNL